MSSADVHNRSGSVTRIWVSDQASGPSEAPYIASKWLWPIRLCHGKGNGEEHQRVADDKAL